MPEPRNGSGVEIRDPTLAGETSEACSAGARTRNARRSARGIPSTKQTATPKKTGCENELSAGERQNQLLVGLFDRVELSLLLRPHARLRIRRRVLNRRRIERDQDVRAFALILLGARPVDRLGDLQEVRSVDAHDRRTDLADLEPERDLGQRRDVLV